MSRVRLEGGLTIRGCFLVASEFFLQGAVPNGLDFSGTKISRLVANDIECNGAAIFGKLSQTKEASGFFTSSEGITIENGVFKGLLSFEGAQFTGASEANAPDTKYPEISINARSIRCENSVHLGSGFKASGQVVLNDAHITGNLQARGGLFEAYTSKNVRTTALSAKRAKIDGSVFFGDKISPENIYEKKYEKSSFVSLGCVNPVSYTHLTLPTIYSV